MTLSMLLHWHCKNSYCVKRQCIESIVKHTSLFGGLCSLGFPQGVQLPFRSPVENVEHAFEEITSGNLHIISQAGHTTQDFMVRTFGLLYVLSTLYVLHVPRTFKFSTVKLKQKSMLSFLSTVNQLERRTGNNFRDY